MKRVSFITTMNVGVVVSGMLLFSPLPLAAQEATPGQTESMGHMGMHGMMGQEKSPGMKAEMEQRHEHMEKMHQEMTQELQKQLTALREHMKAMEGISDEKQLLTELKKHEQMTDTLLGTMIEQRE